MYPKLELQKPQQVQWRKTYHVFRNKRINIQYIYRENLCCVYILRIYIAKCSVTQHTGLSELFHYNAITSYIKQMTSFVTERLF